MRRYKTPLIALSILIVLVVVTCCPFGQRVTLRTREGTMLFQSYVPKGEKVWILYTHSVNKGLVEDGYEPVGGQIVLCSSRFRQYGAGIPEPCRGQTFKAHDGYYEISGYDIALDTQWTYVGRIADHRLRIGEDGDLVHYNVLAQPGTVLGLSADSWSILKEIKWRCHIE
ncbi:MAG: DUF1850 domain-containing protein [Clostridia bacterium]